MDNVKIYERIKGLEVLVETFFQRNEKDHDDMKTIANKILEKVNEEITIIKEKEIEPLKKRVRTVENQIAGTSLKLSLFWKGMLLVGSPILTCIVSVLVTYYLSKMLG